jgi:predicted ATPase/DNA-binding SARP family transcriptional activator
MLEVTLLGQFDVLHDGEHLNIPTRNAQSLLAYLILNSGKAYRREKLAGLLWPNSSEENARSNLRHELWRLRKALEPDGESYIVADDLTIAFNSESEFSLDVHRLESISVDSSTIEDLISAISAYQGELLPGFYDEWVFIERDRLEAIFEAKNARLLEMLQAEGRWSDVLEWGNRWIALVQWPEPAYRAMMSAYANIGDISRAVATYERFSLGLQREMGMKPSEQTQALYKRLKSGWKSDLRTPVNSRTVEGSLTSKDETIPTSPMPVARPYNLPIPLTSFIGREKEIRHVERMVSGMRLITITGPGGVGKTRLAIQVANTTASMFNDGAWWVDLESLYESAKSQKIAKQRMQASVQTDHAPITQTGHPELTGVDLVAQAVSKALRIPESSNLTIYKGVIEYLKDKNLLLVLDNCEHLIEACAILAEQVLRDSPEVKILATSRESLGVPGEKSWSLPSLSLPERVPSIDVIEIFKSEAVNLFIERACDILPGYEPDDTEVRTIGQICRQLDGIPLAIELAAARMNLLSAQEITARLDRRFSLLTGGRRTVLPRHQTLRAAIGWSYELLEKDEQILFRRLSIFTDSFTLEAAEIVCATQEIPTDEVLTLLGRLVDKSLLNVEPSRFTPELETRYRFMDTIRSFGRLKLDEAEETSWMRDQRSSYYLQLVEAAEPELRGSKQLIWLTRLKEEHNNLRSVMQWSLDTNDSEGALRLVGSLWRYWWMQSDHNEGREWLGKALSMGGLQPPGLRAKALNGAGILARGQGDFDNASTYLEECVEIQSGLKDNNGIANVLNSLGILAHLQGNNTKAIDHYQESLNIRREIGDKRGIAASLHNLSMMNLENGEFVQAEELVNESLALFQEVNDLRNIAANHQLLGYIMYELGNIEQSEEFFRKSLLTMKDLGQRNDIIECLEGLAGVAAHLNQSQRAARLLGAAQSQRNIINIPVARYNEARYQQIVEKVRNQLDHQTLENYLTEGRSMSLEEATDFALKRND